MFSQRWEQLQLGCIEGLLTLLNTAEVKTIVGDPKSCFGCVKPSLGIRQCQKS